MPDVREHALRVYLYNSIASNQFLAQTDACAHSRDCAPVLRLERSSTGQNIDVVFVSTPPLTAPFPPIPQMRGGTLTTPPLTLLMTLMLLVLLLLLVVALFLVRRHAARCYIGGSEEL